MNRYMVFFGFLLYSLARTYRKRPLPTFSAPALVSHPDLLAFRKTLFVLYTYILTIYVYRECLWQPWLIIFVDDIYRERTTYWWSRSISTVAPPPYSQAAPGSVYLVPFAAGGMVPVGVDNPGYAQLYTAPPAYEASARSATHRATTTGIGSVTSLREAAKDDG